MAYDDIVLKGYVYDDAGAGVNGATVKVYAGDSADTATSGSSLADTTTSSDGMWTITSTNSGTDASNRLDVEIVSSGGSSKRRIKYRDSIQVESIDAERIIIRGVEGGAATMSFFADGADDAGDYWRINVVDDTGSDGTFAIGSDKASEGTIIDYITVTNGATAAASLTTILGQLVVGVNDTGADVKFFGATAGSYWLWDESADGVVQIGTLTVGVDDAGHDVKLFGNTASAYMLWDASEDDLVLAGAAGIDLAGNIDVDGTANLDVVDIDGAVQIDATFTSGVDGQGYDTKFFGDTSGAYILWDTSADKLLTAGGAVIDIVKDKLLIGGTAVTTTAAELNLLDTASANSVVNSKAVIYGSSGELAGTLSTVAQGNVTSLGTLTTLTVDSIIINGTNIGHTSDTDAIAISSGGVVTMNQIPVFSAGINVSGGTIAGTLATAAQGNVTSLGTLTTLTVDNVITNGTTIGHTDDTDLMTVADGVLTVAGEVDATTLDLSSSADIAGDLVLSGGADGALQFTNAGENSIKIPDNQASALIIEEGDNAYITFVTTNSSEAITVAKATTFSVAATLATGSTIGNLTLANGSITDSGGALDFGNETLTTTGAVDFGAATVDSLSVSDANITNVADIALDSISADGTDINVAVSDNSATALTIKQGSDAYLIVDTANSSESVAIGTGISGTAISIGHATSETTVNDNLTVTGDVNIDGGAIDGTVIGANSAAAITGSTIDASTDFTVGDTVITNGTITDSTGLTIAAAVDLGANTLTSTGSMQIRTIDYSDGDLAMTIADGGGVSFATDVNINANDLNNVGASGNNWTTNSFTLDGSEGITAQNMTIGGTTGNKGINLTLNTGAAGNQQCNVIFYQGAGNGTADNMGYILGMDTNAAYFRLRSHATDSTTNGTDADIFRVPDHGEVMTLKADHGSNHDYVCDSCGKGSINMFTCCGEVKWHDDVLALREMALGRKGLEHMAKLGVMEISEDPVTGREWIGINLQPAQFFTWSALGQLHQRMNAQYDKFDDRLARIEQALGV